MADFMENRLAPIEPVSFGVADADGKVPDALVSAYKYLQSLRDQAAQSITAPVRALTGAAGEAAGKWGDYQLNALASVLSAKRKDPSALATMAAESAQPAYEDFSQIGKGASSLASDAGGALERARQSIIKNAGLVDTKGQNIQPAPAMPTSPPVAPQKVVAAPAGALPPAVARRQPAGAFPPADTLGNGDLYAPQAGGNTAEGGGGINALAPQASGAPEKGLRDQYLERIAGMNRKAESGMTAEQKGQALLEAGLAMMASASRPGSSALGAIGEGGMKGTAVARDMERINRERADRARAEDRANIGTEFQLAGQDEDRAIRKEDKTETRRIREEDLRERSVDRKENAAINARKIDLLERQLEEGRTKVVEDGATGTYSILNTVTGEKKPTSVKVSHKDDTPAEVRLLHALRKDPALLETYKEIKGEKGGISDSEQFKAAMGSIDKDMTGTMTAGDAVQRARQVAQEISGKGKNDARVGTTVSRKSATYQQALKDARINGDTKKLDEAITKSGRTVTD